MALFRQVHVSFWRDGFVSKSPTDDRYFYLYLMTNGSTSQCGIYELPKKIMCQETDFDIDRVNELLQKLIEAKKIDYCKETEEIILLNWMKYNQNSSPSTIKFMKEELDNVKHEAFVDIFYEMCEKFKFDFDGLLQEALEKQPSGSGTGSKNNKKTFEVGSIQMSLTLELVFLMRRNNPKVKIPEDLNKWALEIDKMLRIDERPEEDIRKVIYFTQADDFWKCNILSTKKLREKFDQLYLKSKNFRPKYTSPEELDNFKQLYEELMRKEAEEQ
ncbi:MAG TPA: hypothetical protein VEG39_10960 [Clostridia bacterium]|nr:hypothetical protein [Clostridia bacterium]